MNRLRGSGSPISINSNSHSYGRNTTGSRGSPCARTSGWDSVVAAQPGAGAIRRDAAPAEVREDGVHRAASSFADTFPALRPHRRSRGRSGDIAEWVPGCRERHVEPVRVADPRRAIVRVAILAILSAASAL